MERLAAYFLNTYVAEYVGNVVTEQLTIGWLGDVELEKLPLKKNALHKHQLPFDIVSGFIGKLKLQIPVRYIKSQPWVVQIDQVYVILGPSHPDKYDEEEEEGRGQAKKQAELAKLEHQWREEQRLKTGGSGWWFLSPFSLSLPSNIISNLQVIINDVHVRYEDSSPGVSPFSLGVLVSSISVQSTDENWRKQFSSECDKDYKLMDVVDFSVYWDSQMVGDLEGDSLVLALQQKKAAIETQQDAMSASMMAGHAPSVDSIIKPTGGRVKLIRNRSKDPLKSSEGPRVSVEVHLEEIPVEVREEQWGSLVRSGEESVRRWRGRRWRKWKPLVPVSQDPRGWWKFAVMNVVERVRQRNRQSSPQFILHRASQNVVYVALYTQHLALGSVSEEGRKMMEEVEREQSYEELAVLRRLVMTHIKTERDLAQAAQARIESESESGNQRQPGVMQRWFTGWMSGYQGQQEMPPREEEEEELLEELGYEFSTAESTHRDSLFLSLSFTLASGSLTLLTSSPSSLLGPAPLVSLSFSSLCSLLEIRPRLREATFELSLGGLSLNDETDDDSVFPALVKHKGAELPMTMTSEEGVDETGGVPFQSGTESPLFRLRASLERGKKINLHVHSRPLDVVYSRYTTDKLLLFLRNPWAATGERGGAQLGAELRSHTTAGIRHRLEELLEGEKKASQFQLSVRLDISAPRIIIPEDVRNRDTQMVILDLGHVTFGSVSDWSEEQEKNLEQAVLLDNTPATEADDDDDEEFATPLSSPPCEVESTDGDSAPSLSRPVGGAEVAAAIENMSSSLPSAVVRDTTRFERYLLKMSEMQVQVWSSRQRNSQQQYLLEKFTLFIRLQRCVDPSPDHAHFSLWASVPSLCFHVDEHKIQSLLMCLHPLTPPTSPSHAPYPHPHTPTQSMYQSALSPESLLQSDPSIQDSIYLSLYEGPPHQTTSLFSESKPHPLLKQKSCDPRVAKERYQRRLQAAMEEVVSAHFSIESVFLSVSSNDQVITELTVPGVTLDLHKRPYDTRLELSVQDLCVMDRFQNFGPEFELILCSEGKNLLNLSSPSEKHSFASSGMRGKSYSYPSFVSVRSTVSNSNGTATPTHTPIRAHHSDIPNVFLPREDFGIISPESPTLLSISYHHLTSFSPDHPAMMDIDLGGGEDENEGAEDWVQPSDGEPEIHKISLHCTGMDVMANQETIVELVSFCQKALPPNLLPSGKSELSEQEIVAEQRREEETSITAQPAESAQTLVHVEVSVVFERLGVRLLRRINRRSLKKGFGQAASSSAYLIASLMFHRLSVEAKRSEDTSVLEGQLEGIKVTDLTEIGRKYRDILTIGNAPGEKTDGERIKRTGSEEAVPHNLRFSVHISPQSGISSIYHSTNDVHFSISVPSIHYTHSVNLVREMEIFVSEFKEISQAVMETFSSATVGVAKRIVNEKSQFAKQLSTSLGPRSLHSSAFHPTGMLLPEIETVDAPLDSTPSDHLYLEILVQSPVITLPSSLHGDKCLVAYLGEISVKNSFGRDHGLTDSLSTSIAGVLQPERETLAVKIDRMSLHATHDVQSRELLVASGGKASQQGKWWKVLDETSAVVKIDRRVGRDEREEEGRKGSVERDANLDEVDFKMKSEPWIRGSDTKNRGQEEGKQAERQTPSVWVNDNAEVETNLPADVAVTGEICDPLLISLPKEVFDQIRVTLKHGIYKAAPQTRKKQSSEPPKVSHSVTSSLSSQGVPKSEQSESRKDLPQTLSISFSLPQLSLQLKHTIDAKEKDLVFISFEEFTANCHKSEPYVTLVELGLKSIVIEDLIQEKESEYRYILASSTKPFTGISPLRSTSSFGLQRLTLSSSPLSHPLLPLSHLMSSTPRVAPSLDSDSPLRSFTPHNDRGNSTSQTGFKPETSGSMKREQVGLSSSETSFATPKARFSASRIQEVKMSSSEPSLPDECEVTGSTLRPEGSSSHGNSLHSNTSGDVVGLLSIKAMFMEKEHPHFTSRFNSVGGQINVEFCSASVIINLQTWVLLLDYLGIGIPTPPPSPSPSSLLLEEEEDEDDVNINSENNSLDPAVSLGPLSPPSPSHPGFTTTPHFLRPSPLSPTGSLSTSLFSSSLGLPTQHSTSSDPHSSASGSSLKQTSSASESQEISSKANSLKYAYQTSSNNDPVSEKGSSSAQLTEKPSKHQLSSNATERLDFLQGRGGEEGDNDKGSQYKSEVWGVEGKGSLDISLKVRSLTVTFNKPEHPLAQGMVSELVAKVETRHGNLQLSGRLGQASVVDLTETGAYYRERFTTTGDPALTFEIFKFGRPDPNMDRPFDISARLDLASVRYLHTMRFLKEVLAFCSHFPQLIDAFQRMKAMAQGNLEYDGPDRKARISLDVDLTEPILLIPKHAFSPEIMVGDFGHVKVTNSTRYDGEEGTLTHMNLNSESDYNPLTTPTSERSSLFSQALPTNYSDMSDTEEDRQRVEMRMKSRSGPCLLDCIKLELTEVDVFSALKVPKSGEKFKIVRQRGKVLKEKGELTLYIERNLFEDFCRDVPDLHIEGTLSAIHVMLDKTQLELVKGLLAMNLGESIEDFEKPSSVIRDPIAPPVAAEVWTGFLFRIKFLGVQLEFIQQRQSEVPGSLELSLALFDIQDSEFSFCSRSDQTRSVDFTNHAVIGYDTRYSGYDDDSKPSVFSEVLRPRFKTTDNRPIQVQIHVIVSPTRIGATIILNKLRLIGLFDLLLLLKSFVFDSIPEDLEMDVDDEVDFTPEVSLRQRRKPDSQLKPWKRPPPVTPPEENKPPREVKVRLSITETDIVVVEDLSSASSNAVVLKGTLMLTFRSLPNAHKLLYTSIDALELFSCNLDNEDESALSILDPVTITMEIKAPNDRVPPKAKGEGKCSARGSAKSDDEAGEGTMQPFEVEFKQLNVRLSYNDLKMFLAIAQSLPPLTSPPSAPPPPSRKVNNALVRQMLPLGYTKSEIRQQLFLNSNHHTSEGHMPAGQEKGKWEVEEGQNGGEKMEDSGKEETGQKFTVGKIELSIESVSVCLIDDSANRDVPLLELSFSEVQGVHDPWRRRGEAKAVVGGDYYNRHISAWEPVLEPWKLKLIWEKVAQYNTDQDNKEPKDRMYLKLTSSERLCVNVTSSLIQLLVVTQSSWRQDLEGRLKEEGGSQLQEVKIKSHRRTGSGRSHDQSHDPMMSSRMERGLALLHSVRLVSETRQRSKFIPFLLRNSTGLRLQFATLTSVPSQVYVSPMMSQSVGVARGVGGSIKWVWVEPGAEQAFDFSVHSKRRHQETRLLIVHQLLVKVAGWSQIDIPVSVDKIGVFFREVRPSNEGKFSPHPPRWLVFAISLSDTCEIINVRSSLVLHNTTELTLDVRLEKPLSSSVSSTSSTTDIATSRSDMVDLPVLPARGYTAVPLYLTEWGIRVRPHGWGTQYSGKNLVWRHATGQTPTSHVRTCEKIGEEDSTPFRFCVSVQRENFPLDPSSLPLPAHTLTILPPLTISNLLPCDIQVFLDLSHSVPKMVRRGKEIYLYFVDTKKTAELNISLEGFNYCEGCSVSISRVGVIQGMIVRDAMGRPLRLAVTTEVLGGSALKVGISCPYWLVNRTGLPLVFRQEGVREEAAGQWTEHEKASSTSPLLYSYQEGDTVEKCSMRLGREYSDMSGSTKWCSPFRMISDTGSVRLFSHSTDGRPDQEFQIGVEIHRGRGQYQNTRVVTFVARYQLENRTPYHLAYLQRHQLRQQGSEVEKKLPLIMPRAIASFHWPRADLDQLLILRVEDISSCQWSGGFPLNKDHSFHIHMRGTSGHSIFVRCNVTLKGATHHVIFSDAALFPTPFRLENLSQIGVSYHQQNTTVPPSLLNPGQSVPYAWDDITQPEKICLQVQGSHEEREFDLERLGERGMLYYERYFYIAASATFLRGSSWPDDRDEEEEEATRLVLDVPQGTAVILMKKDPDRRSQLWRMTSSRQVVHIVSSARYERDMVLSLAGRLPPRGQFTPLMVEKKRESRENKQTWRFTEDGRLLLDTAQHLCAQSPTELSLREGVDVVLGHISKTEKGVVPPEQQMRRRTHSPGSGRLVVEVISDGPTRLLRIRDLEKKYTHTAPQDDWGVSDYGQVAPPRSSDVDSSGEKERDEEEEEGGGALELDFSVTLDQGVGVSLINSVPEELVFGSVYGVHAQFSSSRHQQCVNLTVQNLQVDNQLSTSHAPILAYPTPSSSPDQQFSYPIIKFFAERIPHKSPFATVFKVVEVKVREITLLLEERLLFKLLQWAGLGGKGAWSGAGSNSSNEDEEEIIKMLSPRSVNMSSDNSVSSQLYIETLSISGTELRVSMYTTSQLPEDLLKIKKRLGLPLVKFESPIFLSGFYHSHILDSPSGFADALGKHYKGAVHNQALKILGSMDFLGNPVGLVSDVASGVAVMIDSQDVVGLVRDVTHGMSDTTSKLTGTVSHVLGQATFDSSFQEEREQVQEQCQTSGDHLKAGIIGLGSGVFGGMTSIFTQPYRGAVESGVGGFITGVGKGLLGTVAKPVAGLFDLASGTSAALRETMSRISRLQPPPVRHRRCCIGSTGTLTCYSEPQARGQEYLLRLNDGARDEKLVSYELLNENPQEPLKLIISSQTLYFFRDSPPDPGSLSERIDLHDLTECRASSSKTTIPSFYIVISLEDPLKINSDGRRINTKFRCTKEEKAMKVAQLINYAKNIHEEEKRIVRTLRLQQDTIW